MKRYLFSVALLLAVGTTNAQYVHIELSDGEKYDLPTKDIKRIVVNLQAPEPVVPKPGDKVEGQVSIGDVTYTRTVGGTVGTPVDLGLSVKWADHNVGASSEEEYGAYLAWSEVGAVEEGYKDGMKSSYDWSTTEYCKGSSSEGPWKKYVVSSSYGEVDGNVTLEAVDDAAVVNWGGNWRMPTLAEQVELCNRCRWTWTTKNGVNGYEIKGPSKNTIFLPASGYRYTDQPYNKELYGNFWSSTLCEDYEYCAYYLNFNSTNAGRGRFNRCNGRSVRPVCP